MWLREYSPLPALLTVAVPALFLVAFAIAVVLGYRAILGGRARSGCAHDLTNSASTAAASSGHDISAARARTAGAISRAASRVTVVIASRRCSALAGSMSQPVPAVTTSGIPPTRVAITGLP